MRRSWFALGLVLQIVAWPIALWRCAECLGKRDIQEELNVIPLVILAVVCMLNVIVRERSPLMAGRASRGVLSHKLNVIVSAFAVIVLPILWCGVAVSAEWCGALFMICLAWQLVTMPLSGVQPGPVDQGG